MRTWVVVILVAGVLGLGISIAFARVPSAMTPMLGSSQEIPNNSESKFEANGAELGIESKPMDTIASISNGVNNDMQYFYSKIADFGIELKPLDGVPSITEDMAVAIAKHNAPIAGDADHVTAMYASLSDYPAGPNGPPLIMPGTNRVMNNVPVWIVTFHGARILHSGPCMIDASGKEIPSTRDPYVFGDANVVLDAETGEELEMFSYNTPAAASIGIPTTLPSWNGTSLRDMAVRWAALCGDEHPTDMRFVETTRQKAAKLLDGARVDSDNGCYAVVLRGNFVDTKAFTPDGRSVYGTTMTFIVRSTDGAITDFGLNDLLYPDLDTLGTVKTIAP
jgi:hypothetical protein